MKIKMISTLLTGVILSSVLAGCGTESGDGLKNVRVWTGNSHSKTVVSKMVDEFNKTKGKEIGVKIEYVVKGGEAEKGIELAYETGDEPEFCSSGNVELLAEQGKIVAINDLPGGKEFLSTYDPESYENFTFNGKTYKAPYGTTTLGLIYNKDMFKTYGIVDEKGEAKPPKTLTEMREYAKIMTNESKQEYGMIIPLKSPWIYGVEIANISKASSNWHDFNWNKGEYDFKAHKPVYDMYYGMLKDGSLFPGITNMDNDAARAQFAQGKIAMKFGASYDVGVFNDQFPTQCDWGVAKIPTVEENTRYKTSGTSTGFLMINKKAIEVLGEETAFEIFKWFHDDAMMTELYKQGMEIPSKVKIIADTNLENPKKGWKEFADLVNTSYSERWDVPKTIRTGEPSTTEYFLNEFWTGKMTSDQVVETLNASYAKGMQKWFEQNPDKKIENYIDSNYNTKIK